MKYLRPALNCLVHPRDFPENIWVFYRWVVPKDITIAYNYQLSQKIAHCSEKGENNTCEYFLGHLIKIRTKMFTKTTGVHFHGTL